MSLFIEGRVFFFVWLANQLRLSSVILRLRNLSSSASPLPTSFAFCCFSLVDV